MAKAKYSKKRLAEEVDRYFDSISREVTLMERKPTGKKDDKGHEIYEMVPITNRLGDEVKVLEYVVPPSVGDLSAFLGIHRSTWAEYCDTTQHPEFADTTTRARGRIHAYLERESLTRQGKDLKGILFNLQNNYGYTEKREVELGERASKTVSAASMPLAEKLSLLEQIAKDFGGADGEEETQ